MLFMVLRPAAKKITDVMTQPRQLMASASAHGGNYLGTAGEPAMESDARVNDTGFEPEVDDIGPALKRVKRPRHTQALFDHVSNQIKKEPSQSVRLLETWINTNDSRGE